MAEAMCGPSNALQQFKQQTNQDRTLHQDRLTSRHTPLQGFRSHDPSAASFDPEFEAFQAGLEPPVLDHGRPFQAPAGFSGPSLMPSWASDFQNLNISPPSPMQQQHSHPAPNTVGWAQGFRQHIAQTAPKAQSSSPSPLAFQQRARGLAGLGYQPAFQQQSFNPTLQSKGKEPMVAEQFDDAAFARAFDMASADMMTDVEETTQAPVVEQDEATIDSLRDYQELAHNAMTSMLKDIEAKAEQERPEEQLPQIHGSDIEYQPETHQDPVQQEQAQERTQQEQDALAATAGELLQKVEHNQTDKFKNSQFLNLMRKLRDREMRVEGDKMVETANASSTSTADDTLNVSSIDTTNRVYYGKPMPAPLQVPVDTQQSADLSSTIPMQEQDHDTGRINPQDGQEVVDLLNEPIATLTEDMAPNNKSLSDMLYGANGTLSMTP